MRRVEAAALCFVVGVVLIGPRPVVPVGGESHVTSAHSMPGAPADRKVRGGAGPLVAEPWAAGSGAAPRVDAAPAGGDFAPKRPGYARGPDRPPDRTS